MKMLQGKKTHIVAICMLSATLARFAYGDMTLIEFATSQEINSVFEAFGLSTIRAGIAKQFGR